MSDKQVQLYGRVIISGYIRAKTGLHIGRGRESISVGGLDNAVIRDPRTERPYIPGSSLNGKLRSLAERSTPGAQPNFPRGDQDVKIHVCYDDKCPVCRVFGVPASSSVDAPTRLIVRDVMLEQESIKELKESEAGANLTEVKYEASIDRVTAVANPRPFERVPAGALFGPFEMIFSLYRPYDVANLGNLLHYMELLELDYLGGAGSRGSGQVAFENVSVAIYRVDGTEAAASVKGSLADLLKGRAALLEEVKNHIRIPAA